MDIAASQEATNVTPGCQDWAGLRDPTRRFGRLSEPEDGSSQITPCHDKGHQLGPNLIDGLFFCKSSVSRRVVDLHIGGLDSSTVSRKGELEDLVPNKTTKWVCSKGTPPPSTPLPRGVDGSMFPVFPNLPGHQSRRTPPPQRPWAVRTGKSPKQTPKR